MNEKYIIFFREEPSTFPIGATNFLSLGELPRELFNGRAGDKSFSGGRRWLILVTNKKSVSSEELQNGANHYNETSSELGRIVEVYPIFMDSKNI